MPDAARGRSSRRTGRCTRPPARPRTSSTRCSARGVTDGRRRRRLPAVHRARGARQRRAARRSRCCAQNVHEEPGRFTGEVSIRCSPTSASRGVVVGHSERRQMFGETDEALARKVPALLEAGLVPILCCGETEAQREPARPRRCCGASSTADLAGVETRPRPGGDRLRADLGDRHRADGDAGAGAGGMRVHPRPHRRQRRRPRPSGADPLRRLGQARKRRGAVRAARRRRRRWSAAPRLDPDDFAASARRRVAVSVPRGPARLPVPSLCLVVLDGWGLAEPGPGNAVSLARYAGLRRALGAIPAHDAARPAAATSACPTARWATPRSGT